MRLVVTPNPVFVIANQLQEISLGSPCLFQLFLGSWGLWFSPSLATYVLYLGSHHLSPVTAGLSPGPPTTEPSPGEPHSWFLLLSPSVLASAVLRQCLSLYPDFILAGYLFSTSLLAPPQQFMGKSIPSFVFLRFYWCGKYWWENISENKNSQNLDFLKLFVCYSLGGAGRELEGNIQMLNSGYFWELAICYLYEWPSSLFDECMTYGASSFILSVEVFLRESLDSLSFCIAF